MAMYYCKQCGTLTDDDYDPMNEDELCTDCACETYDLSYDEQKHDYLEGLGLDRD